MFNEVFFYNEAGQMTHANAAAQAPVPSVMMGGSDAGLGRQDEMGKLMSVLATKAAKDLVLELKTP
ncbi:hypothetical protein CC207_08640 [Pseudomonas sp. DrBHI1]|nr:hypothetical protein CC207_08640 [Pseudomonas sp. DrBHI1]